MRLIKFLLLLLLSPLTACNDLDRDIQLNFVGDSIVARWPLAQTFPTQYVKNCGLSGSGIKYLQSLQNQFIDKTIVVEIGTNDLSSFTSETMLDYARQYIDALCGTGASQIYLYSILPREFKGDSIDINTKISQLNSIIYELTTSYPHITYLDVFTMFLDSDHINYQYYSDGLHINIYGYEVLSRVLLNSLKF